MRNQINIGIELCKWVAGCAYKRLYRHWFQWEKSRHREKSYIDNTHSHQYWHNSLTCVTHTWNIKEFDIALEVPKWEQPSFSTIKSLCRGYSHYCKHSTRVCSRNICAETWSGALIYFFRQNFVSKFSLHWNQLFGFEFVCGTPDQRQNGWIEFVFGIYKQKNEMKVQIFIERKYF